VHSLTSLVAVQSWLVQIPRWFKRASLFRVGHRPRPSSFSLCPHPILPAPSQRCPGSLAALSCAPKMRAGVPVYKPPPRSPRRHHHLAQPGSQPRAPPRAAPRPARHGPAASRSGRCGVPDQRPCALEVLPPAVAPDRAVRPKAARALRSILSSPSPPQNPLRHTTPLYSLFSLQSLLPLLPPQTSTATPSPSALSSSSSITSLPFLLTLHA
jgi:hypothetical protein